MELASAIEAMIERRNLSGEEMRVVMGRIMGGEATPAQIGGFLIGLCMKGETIEEITAAAEVMRELATPVHVSDDAHLVDTCGTGGDGARTLNISTAASFVAAAAGARVAKHGNRSVSSRSGSADVLEAAGVRLDLTPSAVARCIAEVGVGFLFAPRHHLAMRHAIGPRREMGVRTIFNMLGPLTNPARAPNQLAGVFHPRLLRVFAEVLARLGSRHALIVHAEDGLDEISISCATQVVELVDGNIRQYTIAPEDFNLARAPISALVVTDAADSLAKIHEAFSNRSGAVRDVVALNAGAAIYAAGLAADLQDGVARARTELANGAPAVLLQRLVDLTRDLAQDPDGS
ncbi:MAG: anthranilate phosphoribosyltransferase [Acidiferrobacteraceae bacterium]